MVLPNIFTLVTGPDWQLRRTSFKHSFSFSKLRTFEDILKELTTKMILKFEELSKTTGIIEVDKVFGQLTLDVICRVAFGYDMNALDDTQLFEVRFNSLV